jgi:hypothetical protein
MGPDKRPLPDGSCWPGSRMSKAEYALTWGARLAVVRAIGVVAWFVLLDAEADDAVRAEAKMSGGGATWLAALRTREPPHPARVASAERASRTLGGAA